MNFLKTAASANQFGEHNLRQETQMQKTQKKRSLMMKQGKWDQQNAHKLGLDLEFQSLQELKKQFLCCFCRSCCFDLFYNGAQVQTLGLTGQSLRASRSIRFGLGL